MNRVPVTSSLIKSAGYDKGVLEVEFAGGGAIYQYQGLSRAEFDDFLKAKSVGQHFTAHIKAKATSFKKVEPDDTQQRQDVADAEASV